MDTAWNARASLNGPARAVTDRFAGYVNPHHPILAELFSIPAPGAGLIAVALADLQRRTAYVSGPPGYRSFDALHDETRSAAGALRVNCINRSNLLVSRLRAAGAAPADVFVAIGVRRGPAFAVAVHAWVAVRASNCVLWIDPVDLEPRALTWQQVQNRYAISVLFNDRCASAIRAEQQRWLEPRRTGRECVFGYDDPHIVALVRSRVLRRIVGPLFERAAADCDRVAPGDLSAAEALGLVRVDARTYCAGPKLTVVTAAEEEEARHVTRDAFAAYASAFATHEPMLRGAFGACRAAEDFDWNDIAHVLVAGLTVDVGVGRILGVYETERTLESTAVLAFERLSACNPIGVRWAPGSAATSGLGQIWHHDVWRTRMDLTSDHVRTLERLADGECGIEGKSSVLMRYLGLIRSDVRAQPLAIPVFRPADVARMSPVIRAAAHALVRDGVRPAFDRLSRHGWWKGREDDPARRLAGARLVLEYGVDTLVDAGLLPRFPVAPHFGAAWGRCLWMDKAGGPNTMAPPKFPAER